MADTARVYEDIPPSAMIIVAHPDDAEFMAAGTLARWARAGSRVVYLLVTSGDKGSSDPTITREALVLTRQEEQRAAARILGAKEVLFLGYEDGVVIPSIELRRDIAREIRRLKPHAVLCQDPTRFFSGSDYINHPDHRAVGEAALAAVYPAARDRMTFPELLAEGLEPHKVQEVFVGFAERTDVIVDISQTLDAKVASLLAHRSQMGDWQPAETVATWARETAQDQPIEYGEAFRYFKLD